MGSRRPARRPGPGLLAPGRGRTPGGQERPPTQGRRLRPQPQAAGARAIHLAAIRCREVRDAARAGITLIHLDGTGPYCSNRSGLWHPLTRSARAAPLQPRRRKPPLSVLAAWQHRESPVQAACCSLWFRYGFRGFCRLPAFSTPECLAHSSHHIPPYYSDAAGPEMVTALWRRKCRLRPAIPSASRPGKLLLY